jgi:hypothetical protein
LKHILLVHLHMTTYLDAAYHILQQAGQPLRYEGSRARAGAAVDLAPMPDARGDDGLAPEHGHVVGRRALHAHRQGAFGIVAEIASRLYNGQQQHE